jgi:tripartite-type tricarboxylate transporter receptor subunit TctC
MALCAALPLQAAAQYPSKPITLVVPFTAGAANDVLARTLAAEMKDFGTVVVDNKPGANGEVAAMFVKRAPADGHTLTTASASTIINTAAKVMRDDLQRVTEIAKAASIKGD